MTTDYAIMKKEEDTQKQLNEKKKCDGTRKKKQTLCTINESSHGILKSVKENEKERCEKIEKI